MDHNRHEHRRPRRIPVHDLDAEMRRREELPAPSESEAEGHEPIEDSLEIDGGVEGVSESPEEPAPDNGCETSAVADTLVRLAEMEDRWKRAAADLENYRKRFERELARQRQAERETVLRAWLDVVDNMERALCAQGASENPWYEGMEAIHQQMLAVLERFGVLPLVPMGEKFNPELHDAVATANVPGQPDGTIVEVVQTGYLLDGRPLRPAKVIAVKRE